MLVLLRGPGVAVTQGLCRSCASGLLEQIQSLEKRNTPLSRNSLPSRYGGERGRTFVSRRRGAAHDLIERVLQCYATPPRMFPQAPAIFRA